MMANLASRLIAAEGIVTTEAKAKALRPVAEKLITKAKKGGVHQQRQVVALIRDKDIAHKLFDEIGAALRATATAATLRILKLGPRPGDNAPMARIELVVTQLPLAGAGADARPGGRVLELDGRLRRHRLPRLRRAARAAHRRGRAARRRSDQVLRHDGRRSRAPGAPTPACTRGARWCRFDGDAGRRSGRLADASLNAMLGPEVVVRDAELVDAGFDARRSAHVARATATRSSTGPRPIRSSPATAW